MIEGVLYDAKGIADVAKIPGREELLSRLLGSLQSPVANFARVLNQIAEKGGEAAPAEEVKAEAPAEEAVPAVDRPEPYQLLFQCKQPVCADEIHGC